MRVPIQVGGHAVDGHYQEVGHEVEVIVDVIGDRLHALGPQIPGRRGIGLFDHRL